MGAVSAAKAVSKTPTGQTTVFVMTAGLLASWGLALWLFNALSAQFTAFFALSPTQWAWTHSLFGVVYFALAGLAALFHRQFGYKLGILFGLSVFALSAFLLYFGIISDSCGYFLGAIVMLGVCGAWLDTSLTPLAVEAGRSQTSVVRLNLAYAFNGLGVLAGCIAARWLIQAHYKLSLGATAQLSARPYVLVGLGGILLAYLIEQMSLPGFVTKRADKSSSVRGELYPLLGDRDFRLACASLFAYFAVLTIIWSAYPHYSAHDLPGHSVGLIEKGFLWFAVGRCVGTVFMRWIDPVRLLQWCTALCLIAIVMAAVLGGMYGWACLLSASLFLSITFPTVFGLAISRQRSCTKIASGVLMTATGIGNALAPLFVTPALEVANARIVVLLALPFLAIILAYSLVPHSGSKEDGNTEAQAAA